MKVKTSELIGKPLDYAVAKSITKLKHGRLEFGFPGIWGSFSLSNLSQAIKRFDPSSNWLLCGCLIEEYHLVIESNMAAEWCAQAPMDSGGWSLMRGPSPMVAACRAIVTARWGDTVDIPDELVKEG